MIFAYTISNTNAVKQAWPLPNIALGNGVECRIGSETGVLHSHKFEDWATIVKVTEALSPFCTFDPAEIQRLPETPDI